MGRGLKFLERPGISQTLFPALKNFDFISSFFENVIEKPGILRPFPYR
jgi:hypothetical protein